MANYRTIGACAICGREKECTEIRFIPKGEDRVRPKPYVGTVKTIFPGEFSMRCCEDCGRERGSVPKKAWIIAIAGHILMIGGFFLNRLLLVSGKTNDYVPLMAILIAAGWFMAMIAGCVLVMKNHQESGTGGIYISLFAQFFSIFGLLALAAKAKNLNRCARATSVLKPVAEEKRRRERETDEALARRVESGAALTEAEQALLEEREREKKAAEQREQYAREAQEQKTNIINMRRAVLSILFTIGIGLYGADVYSSDRGYMQLFRSIDLSPEGFAAVIGVLIVWDVIALASAMKKRK